MKAAEAIKQLKEILAWVERTHAIGPLEAHDHYADQVESINIIHLAAMICFGVVEVTVIFIGHKLCLGLQALPSRAFARTMSEHLCFVSMKQADRLPRSAE